MSSRVSIELVCDGCSYVETFVYLERNQNGAVASINIPEGSKRRGWSVVPYEDSTLLAQNFCPHCNVYGVRKVNG